MFPQLGWMPAFAGMTRFEVRGVFQPPDKLLRRLRAAFAGDLFRSRERGSRLLRGGFRLA
jgi:hypothetical protein